MEEFGAYLNHALLQEYEVCVSPALSDDVLLRRHGIGLFLIRSGSLRREFFLRACRLTRKRGIVAAHLTLID